MSSVFYVVGCVTGRALSL